MLGLNTVLLWCSVGIVLSVPLLFFDHLAAFGHASPPLLLTVAYHALLVGFVLFIHAAAVGLMFPRFRGWPIASAASGALLLAGLLALGWLYGESYPGLRNVALTDALLLFAVLSPFWVLLLGGVLPRWVESPA